MNYMSEVAKMLGVELGERFKLFDKEYDYKFEYYLSDDGIVLDGEGLACDSKKVLHDILCGKYYIKRKPWKPKNGEKFWFVEIHTDKDGYVGSQEYYYDCSVDVNFYKIGNCYRTKEEAKANIDKWVAFYKSDEVLEV